MVTRDIDIRVDASTGSSARDVRAVADATDDLGNRSLLSSDKIKGAMATAGLAVAAFGIAAAVDLAKAGQDLDLMANRVGTIFDTSADDVRAWSEDVNRSMGTSSERVAGLAADVGDLLVPLGATREQAAELAMGAVELGSALDLWSTKTATVEEATAILQRGILGETEGLKALGIQINQAAIDTYLLETGQGDLEGQARDLAEAQAVLELATRQSGDALAFSSSESAEAQLQARELKARYQEVKDQLSLALVPAVEWLTEKLLELADWIESDGAPAMAAIYELFIEPTIEGFEDMITVIGGTVSAIQSLIGWLDQIPSVGELFSTGGKTFVTDAAVPATERSVRAQQPSTSRAKPRAMGGETPATAGGELLLAGEAGEAEITMPRERFLGLTGAAGASASYTVNVTVPPTVDTSTIGAAIVDAIAAFERRNSASWRTTGATVG